MRVRVAPKAATPEPTAQVRRSLLPSSQTQGLATRWHAQGI
jgi:hypothetical protein